MRPSRNAFTSAVPELGNIAGQKMRPDAAKDCSYIKRLIIALQRRYPAASQQCRPPHRTAPAA